MAKKNKEKRAKRVSSKEMFAGLKPGPGKKSREMASFWLDQVDKFTEDRSIYYKKANNVIKRFRDERTVSDEMGDRRMNMLWANTKIMLPAVYSRKPTVIIDRKFLDRDPVARLSSMIAERAMRNEVTDGNYHRAIKGAVLDRILVGEGQVWVRYDSEIGKSDSIPSTMNTSMEDELNKIEYGDEVHKDSPEEESLEDTGEQVIRESVPVDYVYWKDFYTFPVKARVWEEVQAVGKKVLISREEAVERFGDEIGEAISSQQDNMNSKVILNATRNSLFTDIAERSITVYEIWNKTDRKVYWVSPGYQYLCDVKEDPLELSKFFPCPKPLFATMTNDTLIPVPDFLEWQDQALQIDELTRRLAMLVKACRVSGTYDASNSALARVLDEGKENNLIPVDNWAIYAEKGGIAGSISFVPLKEIQSVIDTLIKVRALAMQDLDTITGVNDIMRGTTDSRETLGGIRLKNNNTGTRLSETQNEVADFAKEVICIMTEVMCKHFSQDSLVEQSGVKFEEELDPKNIIVGLREKLKEKLSQQPPAMPPPMMGHNGGPDMPPAGMPPAGMPPAGMPPAGMPPAGMPPAGMPPAGMPPAGMPPAPAMQPLPPSPEMIDKLLASEAEKIIQDKIEQSVSLLRNDIPRRYRIDIETDSTIYADAAQERADATEFVGAFTKFVGTAEQLAQNLPEVLPLMGKMLQFAVRKFRAGRDLEYCIDEFVEKMAKKAIALENAPKEDPDAGKKETEKIKQAGEIQKQQLAAKAQAENDARDAQKQMVDDQREMQREQLDAQNRQSEMAANQQLREREFALKMAEMDRQEVFAAAEHRRKLEELELKAKEAAAKRAERKEKTSTSTNNASVQ